MNEGKEVSSFVCLHGCYATRREWDDDDLDPRTDRAIVSNSVQSLAQGVVLTM